MYSDEDLVAAVQPEFSPKRSLPPAGPTSHKLNGRFQRTLAGEAEGLQVAELGRSSDRQQSTRCGPLRFPKGVIRTFRKMLRPCLCEQSLASGPETHQLTTCGSSSSSPSLASVPCGEAFGEPVVGWSSRSGVHGLA
jgi:hypothetical protein